MIEPNIEVIEQVRSVATGTERRWLRLRRRPSWTRHEALWVLHDLGPTCFIPLSMAAKIAAAFNRPLGANDALVATSDARLIASDRRAVYDPGSQDGEAHSGFDAADLAHSLAEQVDPRYDCHFTTPALRFYTAMRALDTMVAGVPPEE